VRLRREEAADSSGGSAVEESQSAGQAQRLEEALEQAQQQTAEQILDDILTFLFREERKSGPQSPAVVAERTGLREPAVGHTMLRLLETGWLNVDSPPRSQELRFSLSDERGLVIGMSLNRDHVDAVLTSFRTARVMARRRRTLSDTSPRSVVQAVADLVEELRGEAGAGRDIIGLGVALAGRVDGPTGAVLFAPELQTADYRWNGVPLEADLEEGIRAKTSGSAVTHVVVENDANALGMHEYLLQGEDQSVCVVLMSESGEGIGAGLVINHAIAHGTGGVSGEIGRVVVVPGGERCRCGGRGCLEAVASAAAIVKEIRKTSPIESLKEASALAERGDRAAIEAFATAGQALGQVLSNVSAIAGPARLVIFGPRELTKEPDLASARAFLDGVRRSHGQMILGVKVHIEPRELDSHVLCEAAAALVVHYFLSRPQYWVPTIAGSEPVSSAPEPQTRLSAGTVAR
jgi:predicted NBD/HSP70 family sugar kinase